MLQGRTRWGQGGFQLVGIAITLGIAIVCGLLIGLFSKFINSVDGPGDLFNDHNYIEQDVSAELRQVKEVRVQQ
jgi:hypothetical protein